MTTEEAIDIWHDFYSKANPSEADEFAFVEACEYLISGNYMSDDVTGKAAMYNLGAFYYERQEYALALKYYEMAFHAGVKSAAVNLGYIWYYGRTGKVDYDKAFHYYTSVMSQNATTSSTMIATYKVADMYKNGYYAAKDISRYKAMIREVSA